MADDIPEWAKERADQLTGDGNRNATGYWLAFARYIAEHEDPPVDPLLLEAREIAARHMLPDAAAAAKYRSGGHDEHSSLKAILAALRRGIELAKEQSYAG